jgi:nicotinate phosphoribosyltransferase
MLQSILDLTHTTVKEVMVPRTEMVALNVDSTKEAIFDDAMWRQKENLVKLLKLRENEFNNGEECDFTFTEFGTRRRMCKEWQRRVLEFWNEKLSKRFCWGTSSIYFAREMGLQIVGTHPHELDSAHFALTHPLLAKTMAMDRWLDTFGGDAGITLTDTFTTKHFLTVFNKKYANAFVGVRHDSGPWREWAERMIQHYEKLGIDPKTKILLFSDGLDFATMIDIYLVLHKRCIVRFGIGTNVTNSCLIPALQIVVKLVSFDGGPVLKISDNPGKIMCEDPDLKQYALHVFGA